MTPIPRLSQLSARAAACERGVVACERLAALLAQAEAELVGIGHPDVVRDVAGTLAAELRDMFARVVPPPPAPALPPENGRNTRRDSARRVIAFLADGDNAPRSLSEMAEATGLTHAAVQTLMHAPRRNQGRFVRHGRRGLAMLWCLAPATFAAAGANLPALLRIHPGEAPASDPPASDPPASDPLPPAEKTG